jgi:hypothetical protein
MKLSVPVANVPKASQSSGMNSRNDAEEIFTAFPL